MAERILHLSLTKDQLADLVNALEDYRDDFRMTAEESERGFGLDRAYWNTRVEEVQQLLELVATSSKLNRH
ncbi:hypothetical protein [Glutamicibacter arilaitensis]|uniref:hypothetical protein n=1 Tax=Glutamicibacter arilaitensis TaxID=256701 RepID=UPI00384E3FFE